MRLPRYQIRQQRPRVKFAGRGERSAASLGAQSFETDGIAIDHAGSEPDIIVIVDDRILAQDPA